MCCCLKTKRRKRGTAVFTCVSRSCGLVRQQVCPGPSAAPEPADGTQTPGTADLPSPVGACAAEPATAPPRGFSERSVRRAAPLPRSRAPGTDRGSRSDLELDDGVGPWMSGVLEGLVWELGGLALWFYLQTKRE